MAEKLTKVHRELLDDSAIKIGERDGTPIEKSVVLNDDYMIEHEREVENLLETWIAYPDIFLDTIAPADSEFTLFFYQRIFLRAIMRYREVYVCASRAFSKSFLSILALFLQCVFMPGTKRFIVAPHKNQAAGIAKQKIEEIYQHWPILRKEVIGWEINEYPGNFGKDYVQLKFKNGSQFDVVGGDGARGLRRHGGLLDEIRDADEVQIQEVILPLMNVSRRLPDNTVNEKEPNQQQIICTSAGVKASYAYERLIDVLENSIIDPQNSFVFGCDYRVPSLHGLVDRNFINKLKLSPSYDEQSFSREYLSYWSGSSEESWFNFDKLTKYRKLKNPEMHAKNGLGNNQFYLLSVDVGRLHDQSVVTVFKVTISSEGRYACSVVNIEILGKTAETKPFKIQALDIKKLIERYNPKEVVIDCNGLGIGLADEMIQEHWDAKGKYYPPYGFFNNDDYKKIQPADSICILYSMKANGPLKSKINGNAYNRSMNGSVRFLIKEQEAKSSLLATKAGQKMKLEERVNRLMPHEMTTKLFDEMANLRLKKTGTLDVILEPINARYPDDKYYSYAYGLYRIKELEEENSKKKRRRGSGPRQLFFYSGG